MNGGITITSCVLVAWLLSACAASTQESVANTQETADHATIAFGQTAQPKTATGKDAATSYLPKPPAIFGVPWDTNPQKLENRLEQLGYERETWTLEAPYTRLSFRLEDDSATYQRVDMLVCNHPFKIASLSIQGKDPDAFYEAVKKRFNLGSSQWEKDDRADLRHGKYQREFAGHTWVVLNSERQNTQLTLEARDVMENCRNALTKDVQDLRMAEEAEIENARQKQRDSF